MTYGPTLTPTASAIAFDGDGNPRLWWDCGLSSNPRGIPRLPKLLLDVETQEGASASAMYPSGIATPLVSDPGREFVTLHWAVLSGPVLGPTIGAHVVTEQRSDGLVVVEVVPTNGACVPQVPFSWPGCLRFSSLRLRVLTPGWAATDFSLGDAGDWYFGIGVGCAVRFVLYQPAVADAQDAAQRLAALADLELPNPFPGLGAGAHVLPRSLESRQAPLYSNPPRFGPFWPDTTTTNGYAQGGERVWPVGGFECSPAAARTYAADVSRVLSRHGVVRVHASDGTPVQAFEWPNQGSTLYKCYDNRWSVDPWNWAGAQGSVSAMFGWNRGDQSPSVPQPREVNPGPCATKYSSLAYQPHDRAHNVRERSITVPAWFQCRSWAAWLLIRWNAHDVMTDWSPAVLAAKVAAAEASPGRGAEYPRELAWSAGAVADLLATTPAGPDRALAMWWRGLFLRYLSASALENGFPRNGLPPNSDNGVPWSEGLPVDCGACPWFQLGLLASGAHDLWTAGGGATPEVSALRFEWLMSQALLGGLDNPAMPLQAGNPPDYVGVTHSSTPGGIPLVAENPVRDRTTGGSYGIPGGGSGHAIHDWTHLALWKRCAVDPHRGGDVLPEVIAPQLGAVPFGTMAALKAFWASKPDPWNVIPAAYL